MNICSTATIIIIIILTLILTITSIVLGLIEKVNIFKLIVNIKVQNIVFIHKNINANLIETTITSVDVVLINMVILIVVIHHHGQHTNQKINTIHVDDIHHIVQEMSKVNMPDKCHMTDADNN